MVVIAFWCVKCREYDTKKQNIVLKNGALAQTAIPRVHHIKILGLIKSNALRAGQSGIKSRSRSGRSVNDD